MRAKSGYGNMQEALLKISPEEMSRVVRRALTQGVLQEQDTAVIFYDLARLEGRARNLKGLFPPSALHAVATKANPLKKVLGRLKDLGAGVEAASLPEIMLARGAGFPADRIVFDSPVKTREELRYALKTGVHLNVDSLAELERVAGMRGEFEFPGTVGIRINPQVGSGKILSTSVAGEYSKFGVPLKDRRAELGECFRNHPWLRGVHVHVGSQGCGLELLLEGIAAVYDFVCEVNRERPSEKIDLFDIGGGLPVSYHAREPCATMADYRAGIEARCPGLFHEGFRLITEFGRYIHANVGWVASRVEYVKREKNTRTVMVHVGADLFLRKCLHPDDWHHDMTLLTPSGEIKGGELRDYVIAGPLCFSGDIIDRAAPLPEAGEGDYLLIHDAGAYTFSMWSRYNSRQSPKVLGYYDPGADFEILKPREEVSEALNLWGE